MPYDPILSITDQVHSSIKSSLHNLRPFEIGTGATAYLDSLVLHSPLPTMAETLEAWRTAESHVPHKIRNLGISNISASQLQELYDAVNIKPAIVQNRFYPQSRWDTQIRAFCKERSIVYQSFWTLSGNPFLLKSKEVVTFATQTGLTPPEALYSLVLGLGGITILNGTTTAEHMSGDLGSVQNLREWAQSNPDDWAQHIKRFKALIGEKE